MLNRYNIALIPSTQSPKIIRLANKFADISNSYLLGKESFPHVTLCQFMQAESEIESIWEQTLGVLQEHAIELAFSEFSCFENPHLYWVSLTPNKINILKKMHKGVAKIIKKPLGRSLKFYDAHMTLVNTTCKNFKDNVELIKKNYIPIKDNFVLVLGKSDEVGQLKEIIYKAD